MELDEPYIGFERRKKSMELDEPYIGFERRKKRR